MPTGSAQDAGELNALYKDLLIGVTQFFRDHEAFERLETRGHSAAVGAGSPRRRVADLGRRLRDGGRSLFDRDSAGRAVARVAPPRNIKIFATDVHRASLEFASAGLYDEAEPVGGHAGTAGTLLLRARGKAFQVSPELRQMIVFAPHNLIKDAPFTKLDLISCRNLLIYFQPLAQKKVLVAVPLSAQDRRRAVSGAQRESGRADRGIRFARLPLEDLSQAARHPAAGRPATCRCRPGTPDCARPAARLGFPEVRAADDVRDPGVRRLVGRLHAAQLADQRAAAVGARLRRRRPVPGRPRRPSLAGRPGDGRPRPAASPWPAHCNGRPS